ncbi:MAG TPA: hypothetical protein VGQ11_09860 [Candidatus Acidoferrales bacterium]|nr:hypothetical protein [Candidatus Acidoferrales bacterium]
MNDETHSLAFIAQFDPYRLVPKEAADRPPGLLDKAVYVFRFSPLPIQHREFWLDEEEMQRLFGTKSLDGLLKHAALDRLFTSK